MQYCCFLPSWHFTSAMATHLATSVEFSCTVEVDHLENLGHTYWKANNSAIRCAVSHRNAHQFGSDKDNCGPFTAWLKKQGNNSYFSIFTTIATTNLNNSLVQCLSPDHRPDNPDLVGSDTVKIIGQYRWCSSFSHFVDLTPVLT